MVLCGVLDSVIESSAETHTHGESTALRLYLKTKRCNTVYTVHPLDETVSDVL